MTKNEEDDNIWGLEDDYELSLEFTFESEY